MATFALVVSMALVALVTARAPHVHPLSQFKRPIGSRVQAEGTVGATLTVTPSVLSGRLVISFFPPLISFQRRTRECYMGELPGTIIRATSLGLRFHKSTG